MNIEHALLELSAACAQHSGGRRIQVVLEAPDYEELVREMESKLRAAWFEDGTNAVEIHTAYGKVFVVNGGKRC